MFGFWVCQGLKLRRNTCFRRFKSSLAVNIYVQKPERLALSKMCELQSFFFQKVPISQRLLVNRLGGFEYNFKVHETVFQESAAKVAIGFFS